MLELILYILLPYYEPSTALVQGLSNFKAQLRSHYGPNGTHKPSPAGGREGLSLRGSTDPPLRRSAHLRLVKNTQHDIGF